MKPALKLLADIPEEPTPADLGRLLRAFYNFLEGVERRFVAGERRMAKIETGATTDRAASVARDGVGGQIIDKLLERIEKMNTAQLTTAEGFGKISDKVQALTDRVTPLAATVGGYQAERAAFRSLVIRAASAIGIAIVGAMTTILVENYVLHEQSTASAQQTAVTVARSNKAISSAQFQKIEADIAQLKAGQ